MIVKIKIENAKVTLKIYDIMRNLIEQSSSTIGSLLFEVDTKNCSNGVYFITIELTTRTGKASFILVS